ncbi:MAG: tRNA pseudouridine(13) synthase TruD [Phycisphaerales bacterium]|nr:tRNA pseudouridine(13) synthase TruD [Phycisphaerales bacterium]
MNSPPGPDSPFAPRETPTQYITQGVPGTGGSIKVRPEDFLVDEMPAYQPCGSGEHVYLFIEKRNLSTLDVVHILARHFGVGREAIGFAGMKDRNAITRQVFSVHTPGKKPEDFPRLEHERLQVQWADLHNNKLRLGHLIGNRFSIRIRNAGIGEIRNAKKSLDILCQRGMPNRFGPQRFGRALNNHLIGRAMISSDFEGVLRGLLAPEGELAEAHARARELYLEKKYAEALAALPRTAHPERNALRALARGANARGAVLGLDRNAKRFYLSALQSAIFNSVLDARLDDATFDRLLPGDVAMKHENRACFDVDEAVAADPGTHERLATFEISPTGPMWSGSMRRASLKPGELELAALTKIGLSVDQLAAFDLQAPGMVEGARRPLRVPVTDADLEAGLDEHGAYIRVAFDLPRGAFATVVLEEIMKNGQREEDEHDGE